MKEAHAKIVFPPYGLMPQETRLEDDDKAPGGWPATRPWQQWRAEVIMLLSHILWPVFERGEWRGDARLAMRELTEADFTLFNDLRPMMPMYETVDIASDRPASDGKYSAWHVSGSGHRHPRPGPHFAPAMVTRTEVPATAQDFRHVKLQHATHIPPAREYSLFEMEDSSNAVIDIPGGARAIHVTDARSLPRTLKTYLQEVPSFNALNDVVPPPVDDDITDYLAGNYLADMDFLVGSTDLQLKRHFMRPRAYQVAVILGYDGKRSSHHVPFTHQFAATATTPSMVSGHCLQTSMAGIGAFMRLNALRAASTAAGQSPIPASVDERLKQHTVDVGDRRVMAGVHYPSDNLGSWITALLMAGELDDSGGFRNFLLDSIYRRSRVFNAIKTYSPSAEQANPYEIPLNLLNYIGSSDKVDILAALKKFGPKK